MIDSLGYRLKQLRQERKLKQGQVADIIGVNKRQISAYENDSRQEGFFQMEKSWNKSEMSYIKVQKIMWGIR